MASSEALVDAVIQVKEGLFAVLQAAWDYGCAKQNAAIFASINAIAKGKAGIRSFHEEGHLAVEQLAVSQPNMVSASGNSVKRVLTSVADIFTTNGEPANGGKLPNMVTMQKYFHDTRLKGETLKR